VAAWPADESRDRSLKLTVDVRLQMRAAEILERHLRQAGVGRGALVVMEAGTGDVLAMVDIADERVNDQFKTTFVVRNYAIEITAEAPRTGENVPMPPPTSVSFDQQVGAERAVEKARVVASDIVDRVKAYAKKKHGG
jgi:cell division protein FtsI/penicillin-binding protein 2